MEWLSAGSQPVSICFFSMPRTNFCLETAFPCCFFLMDYGMSVAMDETRHLRQHNKKLCFGQILIINLVVCHNLDIFQWYL